MVGTDPAGVDKRLEQRSAVDVLSKKINRRPLVPAYIQRRKQALPQRRKQEAERSSKGVPAKLYSAPILSISVALDLYFYLRGKCLLADVAASNARVGLTQAWPRPSTDRATFGISRTGVAVPPHRLISYPTAQPGQSSLGRLSGIRRMAACRLPDARDRSNTSNSKFGGYGDIFVVWLRISCGLGAGRVEVAIQGGRLAAAAMDWSR